MSAVTTSGPARTAPDSRAVRPMRRTVENCLCGAGMVLSLLFLGGFALVMNRTDRAQFDADLLPALSQGTDTLTADQIYEMATMLSAWFSFTLMAVLLLGAAGIFFARRRPTLRRNGWWMAAAGLACLLGSQLIAFPIAFVFFVSAGVFALRPVTDRNLK